MKVRGDIGTESVQVYYSQHKAISAPTPPLIYHFI